MDASLYLSDFLSRFFTPRTCSVCSLLTNLAIIGLGQQGRLLSDWLICYPSTQTIFERALPKIVKKQRWRPKERFHVDFALLLVLEFQENVGGVLLCPPFQNGRKMLGDKAQTFRRLLFSLLLQGTVSLVASCCRF